MRIFTDIPWRTQLLTFVSAVLQALIFPNPSIAWLSWIALAPLLLALSECRRPLHGFILAYKCGVLWYLFTCPWIYHVMHVYGGIGMFGSVFLLVLFALYVALFHALFGWIFVRIALFPGLGKLRPLVLAPFLWVGMEYARAHIVSFPWNLLGYSQMDNLVLTRIATVTGVYGISFVIAAVNVMFVFAWVVKSNRSAVFAMTLLCTLTAQAGNWYSQPASVAEDHAILLQPNLPMNDSQWTQTEFDQQLTDLVHMSSNVKREMTTGSLIIWPESPAPFYENDPKLLAAVANMAGTQRSFVVLGVFGLESRKGAGQPYDVYNSALVVAPNGVRIGRYDKIHLVPFGEYIPFKPLFFFLDSITHDISGFSRGSERKVFNLVVVPEDAMANMANMPGILDHTSTIPSLATPHANNATTHKLSVIVCYEAAFPDEVRPFVNSGAEVVVNISNDGWYGTWGATRQHLNIARMRAIENHRWLLRATNTGITASIDPYGRITAQVGLGQRSALNTSFDYISETTFYTRHGDLFAQACAIISIAAILFTFRRKEENTLIA